MMEIIASYVGNDIATLVEYGKSYRTGDYGELYLYLKRLLQQDEIDRLTNGLQGILAEPIKQDGCVVVLGFRYGSSTFVDMSSAIEDVIIPSEIMIGWQLKSYGNYSVPFWGWLALGAIAVVALFESRKKR